MPVNENITSSGPSTLVHAMQILQVTARGGHRGASVDDYLNELSFSRPTLYRLLKGLKQQGFLRSSPIRGRYLLGYEDCWAMRISTRRSGREWCWHLLLTIPFSRSPSPGLLQ